MKYKKRKAALLLLEDGKVFKGNAVGKIGTTTGEICFNTGMTGYQEIFTDPSYYGQIIVMTTSHIGNYGVHPDEAESGSLKIAGLVCKKFSDTWSRSSANGGVQEYFEKEEMVGISDVDTRALVRYIRDKGAMNAIISSEEDNIEKLKDKLSKVPSMQGLELSSKVSTKEAYCVGNPSSSLKIAVIDLGTKRNILKCLSERGAYLKVFPLTESIEKMEEWEPDGFMITNGPGDPSAMPEIVEKIKKLKEREYPMFGICLGHQVLALACGMSTYKMHNGHRGVNHPVKNLMSGKGEITSQNHGFEVSLDDAKENGTIEITHLHLNDNGIAGFRLKNNKCFSVQYHPEASAGPHDSRYLFDQFIEMIEPEKKGRKLETL